MNKVKVHRYNEKYNIIQKYKIEEGKGFVKGTSLGYDVATANGEFVKSFDDFDVAIKWLEAHK